MSSAQHPPLGYGPQGRLPQPPVRPHAQVALRGLLIGIVVAAGAATALLAGAAAWVSHTGCFFTCDEPDPTAAAAWVVAGLVPLAAAAWAVRRIWRLRPPALHAWSWLLAGVLASWVSAALTGAAVAAVVDARCTDVVQVSETYSYLSCDPPAAADALTALAGLAPLVLAARRARRALR